MNHIIADVNQLLADLEPGDCVDLVFTDRTLRHVVIANIDHAAGKIISRRHGAIDLDGLATIYWF